jgi:two-component system nitrate/nitrite response regulator NarL
LTEERQVGVVLVEDDAMVRGWLAQALVGSEFAVVGEADTGAAAADVIARRRPDVLLVDYRLPDAAGTELVRSLRLAGVAVPAIVMTANPEKGFNEAAREATAQGSVLKTGSAVELLEALRSVVSGGTSFDARHPRRDPTRAALSPREREALRLVADGATNPQIAEALGVGRETVKTLLARAFAKLGTTRRAEAVSEAHRQGLL